VQSLQEALAALRDLGSPDELASLAGQGLAPAAQPKVNSHIHLPPNFSAFESVGQAVSLAAEQDVRVVGVSNYYDYGVYGEFVAAARQRGIFPLFGLEIIALIDELVRGGVRINDPNNPGRIYICGKGITRFDAMTDEARRLIGRIRRNDDERMATMCGRLADLFAQRGLATGLDPAGVVDRVVARHDCSREVVTLQERHLAQAFQEALFEQVAGPDRIAALGEVLGAASKAGPDDAVKIQGEIRTHLMKAGKPAFVDETFLDFDQAFGLILELGGIPCYPTLADGASPICEFEQPVEKLIDALAERNIHCVEFIPIRNQPDVLARYAAAMHEAGLVVLAGTEHNTLDLLAIEPTCVDGQPIGDELREVFWQGACVVAAHQVLSLHGRCGFVDGRGRPNPAYASGPARVESLARLGAAVIETYFRRNAPST